MSEYSYQEMARLDITEVPACFLREPFTPSELVGKINVALWKQGTAAPKGAARNRILNHSLDKALQRLQPRHSTVGSWPIPRNAKPVESCGASMRR